MSGPATTGDASNARRTPAYSNVAIPSRTRPSPTVKTGVEGSAGLKRNCRMITSGCISVHRPSRRIYPKANDAAASRRIECACKGLDLGVHRVKDRNFNTVLQQALLGRDGSRLTAGRVPRARRRWMVDRDQLAPRWQPRLLVQRRRKHLPVAIQQHARRELGISMPRSRRRGTRPRRVASCSRASGPRRPSAPPAPRASDAGQSAVRSDSARKPAKPSQAARPWPASSESAASSWLDRSRRRARRSSKNSAPRAQSAARTACARKARGGGSG
jgi:hypothetical protein